MSDAAPTRTFTGAAPAASCPYSLACAGETYVSSSRIAQASSLPISTDPDKRTDLGLRPSGSWTTAWVGGLPLDGVATPGPAERVSGVRRDRRRPATSTATD